MSRALLIAGDEPRFLQNLLPLRRYLETERKLVDLVTLKAAILREDLLAAMATEFLRDPEEPLLLVYSGHGLPQGWVPSTNQIFPYPWLAGLIAQRRGPTLFINACCYPGAVFPVLEKGGISPMRVSVISAGPANKVTYDGMIVRIALSWQKGKPYVPLVGHFPKPIEIMEDDGWLIRKILGLRWHLSWAFRAVEPWNVLAECRWGKVLDHLFIAQDDKRP